ncbi:MAG: hypothetical protein R2733_23895 [Acidimicrobiales bacterium]
MRNRLARYVGTGVVVAGLTLGAAACSDDDGDSTDIDNPVDGFDDQIDSGAEELENEIDSETNDGATDDGSMDDGSTDATSEG